MARNHERLNPLDDPEGPDDFDFPESQESEPPFDLFDDYQEENTLLPHQIAFRQFVKQNRIDPAAFTDTSMFNYELIKSVECLSTASVNSAPVISTQTELLSTAPVVSIQDPFTQTCMPLEAQQERNDRLRSISPLILAHLCNGDISEQNLNIFLRNFSSVQFQ